MVCLHEAWYQSMSSTEEYLDSLLRAALEQEEKNSKKADRQGQIDDGVQPEAETEPQEVQGAEAAE